MWGLIQGFSENFFILWLTSSAKGTEKTDAPFGLLLSIVSPEDRRKDHMEAWIDLFYQRKKIYKIKYKKAGYNVFQL